MAYGVLHEVQKGEGLSRGQYHKRGMMSNYTGFEAKKENAKPRMAAGVAKRRAIHFTR